MENIKLCEECKVNKANCNGICEDCENRKQPNEPATFDSDYSDSRFFE